MTVGTGGAVSPRRYTRRIKLTKGEAAVAGTSPRLTLYRQVRPDPLFVMGEKLVGWFWRGLSGLRGRELAEKMPPRCPFGIPGDRLRDRQSRLWEIVQVLAVPNKGRPWVWQIEVERRADDFLTEDECRS